MFKKWEISLIMGLCVSIILSCVSFNATCCEIRKDVLRLHILANSDDEKDQQLKIKVRDEILSETKELFTENYSITQAIENAEKNKEKIKTVAENTIKSNGYDYKVTVEIKEEYFETRKYENVTLPAGKYKAVRVLIGKADGHNWWCVMYPSMCIPAASNEQSVKNALNEKEYDAVTNTQNYEIRFKAVEIYEQIKSKISTLNKHL